MESPFTLYKRKEDHLIVGNYDPLHVFSLYFRRAGTAAARRARRAAGVTWRATAAHSVSTRTGRITTTCAAVPPPSERSRPPERGTQPPQPWPPPSIRRTPEALTTTSTTVARAPQQRAVRQVLQRPAAPPRGDHRYRQWWWRPLVTHPLRRPRPHSKTLVQFLASRGHLVPVPLRCRRVQRPLRGRMPQNQGQGHLLLRMTRNQRRQLVRRKL